VGTEFPKKHHKQTRKEDEKALASRKKSLPLKKRPCKKKKKFVSTGGTIIEEMGTGAAFGREPENLLNDSYGEVSTFWARKTFGGGGSFEGDFCSN